MKIIDPLSVTSLILSVKVNGLSLSTATGFVVMHDNIPYLITNWHVVSGRDANTGAFLSNTGAIPDTISIAHHVKNQLGCWRYIDVPILDEDRPKWLQHPHHTEAARIDVVALPLTNLPEDVHLYPLDLSLANTDMLAQPASSVSIIGFPFGMTVNGALPIWKTGHIASDPDIDFQGRPMFLIDATTRGGMSGSRLDLAKVIRICYIRKLRAFTHNVP